MSKRQPKPPRVKAPKLPSDVIEPIFLGDTAILVATGPSLNHESAKPIAQIYKEGNVRLFGLNDSYRYFSEMDVFYACDPRWWEHHYPLMLDFIPKHGRWTQCSRTAAVHDDVSLINSGGHGNLSLDPSRIHTGGNSGYQLINLAYHFGIRKMILFGYNMDLVGGMKHDFGDHPKGMAQNQNYRGFAASFAQIKIDGLEIINATPNSHLSCFPKMNLHDALHSPRPTTKHVAQPPAKTPPSEPPRGKAQMISLLFCSRSGSSMVASIFVAHGASAGVTFGLIDPQAKYEGGGRYHSYESSPFKDWIRQQKNKGLSLKEQVFTGHDHMKSFRNMVENTIKPSGLWLFKCPAELWPLAEQFKPIVVKVIRDPENNALSVAKRGSGRDYGEALRIIKARHVLINSVPGPTIYTDQVMDGDFSSIKTAFEHCGMEFKQEIAEQRIHRELWHHEK